MSLYRKNLKQAVIIAWRHKYLWLFGLFATLMGGGEYEIITKGLSGDTSNSLFPNYNRLAEIGLLNKNTFANLVLILKNNFSEAIIPLLAVIAILVIFIFLVWLMVVSQTALVDNSSKIIGGKTDELGFTKGIKAGAKFFWPVVGLNLLMRAVIYLAFLLIALPTVLSVGQANSPLNSLYVVLFIILIPLAIVFAFIIKYAICYVIIKNHSFIQSLHSGWRLFAKNWLVSVEMAFILFLANFLAGLAILLALLILVVPFLFLALILYKLASLIGFWLVIIVGLIALLALVMLGGAALTTFQTVSWTGLFVELINRGGTSKIVRILDDWRK